LAKSSGRGSDTARRRRVRSGNSTSRARTGPRRGGGKATPRAGKPANHAFAGGRSDDRPGVSKLASFLKSSFLRKIAAAGFASAAAALLFKKSDPSGENNDQVAADDSVGSPIAPAVRPTRRTAGPNGQAARRADGNTELASAGDAVSAGPVRTRKKRSDTGSKRARKPDTSSATGAAARQMVPELQTTDTGAIALNADAGAPDQLQESSSELETEAHPS
jgi:hypothetical protein